MNKNFTLQQNAISVWIKRTKKKSLLLLLLTTMIISSVAASDGEKPVKPINRPVANVTAPAISYGGTQTLTVNRTITAFKPVNTGGAVPANPYGQVISDRVGSFGFPLSSPSNAFIVKHQDKAGNIYHGSTYIKVQTANQPGDPYYWNIQGWVGNGTQGLKDGVGNDAEFGSITDLAFDPYGNLFVSDAGNGVIRKVSPTTGVAFTYQVVGPNGTTSTQNFPQGLVSTLPGHFTLPLLVVADSLENVYVYDAQVHKVYKMTPNGNITVLAGSGNAAITDGTGAAASFLSSNNMALDSQGTIYITDSDNPNYGPGYFVRKIFTTGYSISPALPGGLVFDGATGTVSGAPTAIMPPTNYTVTAYNVGGSSSTTLTLAVNAAPAPPTISYPASKVYTINVNSPSITPTSSGVAAPTGSGGVANINAGVNTPAGVAVDAAGNVYVADFDNNVVKELTAGGGTPTNLGTGWYHPEGLAVDAAGNIFVADDALNIVKEIVKSDGSTISLGTGFNELKGVAVDAAGNVYVADFANQAVKKILKSDGSTISIGSGFAYPFQVAVDASGNVYVADQGNSAVKMIPVGGGAPVTLGSGFDHPQGVAVDAAGNVYVSDTNNGAIKEIPAGGGSVITLLSGLTTPGQLALDINANVYFVDAADNAVKKITQGKGGFYISPALPAGLTFNNATGVISGAPTALSPATSYNIIAYNSAGSASATITITVNPPLPSAVYTTTKIYTAGVASTPVIPITSNVGAPGYSSNAITIGDPFYYITGVAADVQGDFYIASAGNSGVQKIPAAGGSPISIGTGFSSPNGVAVDATGNIFIADYGNNSVKEVPAAGGLLTLGSGFSTPTGIALDNNGNIYLADAGNNAVKKIPAGGGSPVSIGSGFNVVTGVTVDGAGNVYVADSNNGVIKEIPAAGGVPVTVASGFKYPFGLTLDNFGNLFVADKGGDAIDEIPAGTHTPISIGSGFNEPKGVATDGTGNIYVADFGNNALKKIAPTGGFFISPALPAGLNMNPATGVISGTPIAAAPGRLYAINVYNTAGNYKTFIYITVNAAPVTTTPPTKQAIHLAFTNTTTNSTSVSWTSGNGSSRAVFLAQTNYGIPPTPSNGTTFFPGMQFGQGTEIAASGWYCIYNGTGSSANISGLTAGTTYRLIIVEYNGTTGNQAYLSTSGSAPANVVTVQTMPTMQAIHLNFTNTTTAATTLSWTNGNGAARAVFVAQTNFGIPPTPTNLTTYNANTQFGTGSQIGASGWYCVYNGTNATTPIVNIGGLLAGTTYRVIIVEYDGSPGSEMYLTTSGSSPANITTVQTAPTTQAIHLSFTNITHTSATASWQSGNGQARAVFLAKTNYGIPATTDHTTYTANSVFGFGTQCTAGWYCIYNGTGTTANITGLVGGTTYRLMIVEYDGTPGNELYLHTSGGSPANFTTTGAVNSLAAVINPELSVNQDVREKANVVANNILSPNGDGVNDTWLVKNIELYDNNVVTVYNSAGNVVFSKKNYLNDWDGTYRGSVLNEGSYYYTIDLGNTAVLKGFVTVVRDR